MTLAEELLRRGRLHLKMEGRRLVFFGVLPRDEEYCESKQEEAYSLRNQGYSFEQIGDALGINRSTAYGYWRREAMKRILSGKDKC